MTIENHVQVLTDQRNFAEISPKVRTMGYENDLDRIGFGRFVLDLHRGALIKDDQEITLRPKTFAFLRYLVANPGRLLSKDELLESVWPNVAVTEDSMVQCVTELRRALGDHNQSLIRTVQRRGYRFDAEVSAKSGSAKIEPPREQTWMPAQDIQAQAKAPRIAVRQTRAGLAMLGSIFLVAIGLWLGWPHLRGDSVVAPPLSIVVLPFTNLNGDPDQEYFAAGLTNDLTADLSRFHGVFVIAPSTAQTFKGKAIDAKQISRELKVRYLLQGDVRRTGDQIRINVQLIDGESGSTRWVERFDKKRDQIAEWQDEVLGRLTIALDHRLTLLESERSLRERPNNPEAFDLTARGWALVYSGKTADNYHTARAFFRQAIERDSRAINAKAGIAWSSGILLLNGWSISAEDDAEIARVAVAELLSADPHNVIAHHVRGFLLRYQRNTEAARDAFATAVAINPNFAPGHAQLGVSELELGRPDMAIQSAAHAIRLSPRDPNARSWFAFMGMGELHQGRDTEAINWLSRAIDTEIPIALHHAYFVSALALSGRVADARLELSHFQKARPSMTISNLRISSRSTNPNYVAQRERLFKGLQIAGLPE